jgi:hypothetical protein
MEHVMRSAPANGRVDPVPRRRGHEDIEAPSAVMPLLERRILDLDVAEGGKPLASERARIPCLEFCPWQITLCRR